MFSNYRGGEPPPAGGAEWVHSCSMIHSRGRAMHTRYARLWRDETCQVRTADDLLVWIMVVDRLFACN